MRTLPYDYARCRPTDPDVYCRNCKRWADHPEQTWGERTAFTETTNSRSEACVYIPISLMKESGES